MSSVEEVKLHLAASVDQSQRAMAGIRALMDQLDEALARLRLTAVGSAHPSLVDAISRLEQARARLDEAHTLAGGAVDAANAYRSLA
jgi:exonuclease VII small subunit